MSLRPEEFRAENEWLAGENLELQDMFDTLREEFKIQARELDSVLGEAHTWAERFNNLKEDFAVKLDVKNKAITVKAIHLTNLVDEYQSILDQYISLTGTKLLTNKLQTLRQQGGYPEL